MPFLPQNNFLERQNRDIKERVVPIARRPLLPLLRSLALYMGDGSRSAAMASHPLLINDNTKATIKTQIGQVYVAADNVKQMVQRNKTMVLIVPGGLNAVQARSHLEALQSERMLLRQDVETFRAQMADKSDEAAALAAGETSAVRRLQHIGVLQQQNELEAAMKATADKLQRVEQRLAGLGPAAGVPAAAENAAAGALRLPNLSDAACRDMLRDAHSVVMPAAATIARLTGDNGLLDIGAAEQLAREWIAPYAPNDAQAPALALERRLQRTGAFYHLRRLQPFDNLQWVCSCPQYFKHYRCMHALALSIADGSWVPPPRFQNIDLLRQKKKGRPRGPGNRYEHDNGGHDIDDA